MIDLHTHTNESDGSLAPGELIDEAVACGLEALAITDHDTFAGYDQAAPAAVAAGLELICGVELSTAMSGARTVHMLGYFLHGPAPDTFRNWLGNVLASRNERNTRLAERLRDLGLDIEASEATALGRTITGRVHFARLLVLKGYAATHDEAFRRYIGAGAPAYVERVGPEVVEVIQRVREAGGTAVLAHPVRLAARRREKEADLVRRMVDAGLQGLEVYHSDHRPADVECYLALARKYGLALSGGSDFHGTSKPHIQLGTLPVQREVLEGLRAAAAP